MQKGQQKNRLVSRLFYISAGALILSTVYFIILIGFDIFQEKRLENFTSMPNHVTGYTMSANMRVMTFDSIINYKRDTSSGRSPSDSGSMIIQNGVSAGSGRKEIDAILHDPTYTKTIIRQTKRVRSADSFNADIGKIDLSPASVGAYISIKPKNIWLTIILAIRNYSLLLCILFVLFQLTRLFRRLKNDFSFNSSLSRTIWKIGNCLLVYQLILFVTGTLVMRSIEAVTYYQETVGRSKSEQVLSLDISYDISFITLFTGLALVVLSKLLDHGYELQQENELTI